MFYQGSAVLDYGLYLLDQNLIQQGRSLIDYQMPESRYNWNLALSNNTSPSILSNPFITEQLEYDTNNEATLYSSNYAMFNIEQKIAFDRIVQQVGSPSTENPSCLFFLHGPAGTGKTFVYNTLANYFRSQRKIVLCVASSGIASLLLTGGRTSTIDLKFPSLSMKIQHVIYPEVEIWHSCLNVPL